MKLLYWTSTSLVVAMLVASAYTYLFHKGTIDGVRGLGFPDFFRIQLAVLKIVGVIALLAPQVPLQVKEWSYAGIGLFFVTAIVAHVAHRDAFVLSVINVVLLALLAVSNVTLHRIQSGA